MTNLITMLIHSNFDDVSLKGLEDGFPVFGSSVPQTLHGDARALVRVQHVDEGLARVLDHLLTSFRLAEGSGEAQKFQSSFLDDLSGERLLLDLTQNLGLRTGEWGRRDSMHRGN